jgi:hypothetical protein
MTTTAEAFEMGRLDAHCGEISYDENPFEGFNEKANAQAWELGFLQGVAELEAGDQAQAESEFYAEMWHLENNYDY